MSAVVLIIVDRGDATRGVIVIASRVVCELCVYCLFCLLIILLRVVRARAVWCGAHPQYYNLVNRNQIGPRYCCRRRTTIGRLYLRRLKYNTVHYIILSILFYYNIFIIILQSSGIVTHIIIVEWVAFVAWLRANLNLTKQYERKNDFPRKNYMIYYNIYCILGRGLVLFLFLTNPLIFFFFTSTRMIYLKLFLYFNTHNLLNLLSFLNYLVI